jgi:hypothetical protein
MTTVGIADTFTALGAIKFLLIVIYMINARHGRLGNRATRWFLVLGLSSHEWDFRNFVT